MFYMIVKNSVLQLLQLLQKRFRISAICFSCFTTPLGGEA